MSERSARGDQVAEAAAKALHSVIKLAGDSDERKRDALMMGELLYLNIHAISTPCGEAFQKHVRDLIKGPDDDT